VLPAGGNRVWEPVILGGGNYWRKKYVPSQKYLHGGQNLRSEKSEILKKCEIRFSKI